MRAKDEKETSPPSIPDFPVGLELQRVKKKQDEIVLHLHGKGYSYEILASIFGIPRQGVGLRNYVVRSAKRLKYNNSYLCAIHKYLMDHRDDIQVLIPRSLAREYCQMFPNGDDQNISYHRKAGNRLLPQDLNALYRIVCDVFKIDESYSAKILSNIAGTYYCYRNSSEKDKIVRSYLQIRRQEAAVPYFDFIHLHADRYYDQKRDDAPRRTHGLVFNLNNNLWLVGNTENGQAVNIFAIRPPFNEKFKQLLGFNVTSNMDHVLLSTRVVLIRDADAIPERLARITLDECRQEAAFEPRLLQNIMIEHICELLSMTRL